MSGTSDKSGAVTNWPDVCGMSGCRSDTGGQVCRQDVPPAKTVDTGVEQLGSGKPGSTASRVR